MTSDPLANGQQASEVGPKPLTSEIGQVVVTDARMRAIAALVTKEVEHD